jgi:membrane protease YdiL (CAAX protease family)
MKQQALYRAGLFALIAFAFSWTVFFATELWFIPFFINPTDSAALVLTQLVSHFLGMMGPALAAFILWRAHKEPAQPVWRWGHLKFYLWSVAFLILLRGAALAVGMLDAPGAFQLRTLFEPYLWIVLGASLTVGWLAGMGEEIGWCAYLLPLLEPSFGKFGATLLSGALRGIWHLPVLVLPLLTQVWKDELTWESFFVNTFMISVVLLFSNILFGAVMSWLWFKTMSMAMLGWTHQWYDLTRDAAALFVSQLAGSNTTSLAYSIGIHMLGLVALLWLARDSLVSRKRF